MPVNNDFKMMHIILLLPVFLLLLLYYIETYYITLVCANLYIHVHELYVSVIMESNNNYDI